MEGGGSRRVSIALYVALCCAALAGCPAKSNRGTITGTVTLDGQPLKAGIIRFLPSDGQTATADTAITDGKFSATVPPGNKKVSISAPKVTGKKRMYETPESPTVDIVEELLPARYNIQTELTLSVEKGNQSKDFDLKSGK